MNYFIATGFEWEAGQIVDNDTFRESPHKTFFLEEIPEHLKGIPDYLARRAAESRFEVIRVARFPDKPSRGVAIFLNATVEAALFWTMKPQRRGYRIYEVSTETNTASASANYTWFNYCVRLCLDPAAEFRQIFSADLSSEIERVAAAYWNNEQTEPYNGESRLETLFVGTLRVVHPASQASTTDSTDAP